METEAMSMSLSARPLPQQERLQLIGHSPAISHLRSQPQRIGPYFRRVLLTGEPGTGKELAARLLHQYTPNAAGPFVCCDASTLHSTLAKPSGITPLREDDTDCLLSAAQGGTLYISNVCEMPPPAQERLLQLLLRNERRRPTTPQHETRIIASSRRDLRVQATAGRFRQDLYHRLSMVEIALPPLRSRIEDISPLSKHVLGSRITLSESALQTLAEHSWPRNVRELMEVLRSAQTASGGSIIEPHHLPHLASNSAVLQRKAPASTRLQDVIDRHVLHILEQCEGNKVRAAELLGISRSTLYRMLETGLSVSS